MQYVANDAPSSSWARNVLESLSNTISRKNKKELSAQTRQIAASEWSASVISNLQKESRRP